MTDVAEEELSVWTADGVTVGVASREELLLMSPSPWAQGPGLYCFTHDAARQVGSSPNLGLAVEEEAFEATWWSEVVLMSMGYTSFSEEGLAYLEDRLAHMLEREGLALGLRAARSHALLDPEVKTAAHRFLLTAIELLEANGRSLFSPDGSRVEDLAGLTAALVIP